MCLRASRIQELFGMPTLIVALATFGPLLARIRREGIAASLALDDPRDVSESDFRRRSLTG
jgi:hypothetical protein